MYWLSIYPLLIAFSLFAEGETPLAGVSEPTLAKEETATPTPREVKGILLSSKETGLSKPNAAPGTIQIDLPLPGPRDALEVRLEPYLGREFNADTIRAIKEEIQKYYLYYNRPFVMVNVPTQKVSEGVLKLVVAQSRLGQLQFSGNKWASNDQIASNFILNSGDELDENQIALSLHQINRNPFRRTDAIYKAGQAAGTTDIELTTQERYPVRGYVGYDNTGIRTTGHTRIYAGINWANVWGLGHLASAQFTSDLHFRRLLAGTVHYTAPCSWGHTIQVYGGFSHIHAPYTLPDYATSGSTWQASLRYQMPLVAKRGVLHEVHAGADYKGTNNAFTYQESIIITPSHTNLTQLTGGYTLNWETVWSNLSITGELFYSPGRWLPNQSKEVYNIVRPGSNNAYVYGRAGVSEWIRFWRDAAFVFSARSQMATANLQPSEQIGLGGSDTVRGYAERQVSVDNAVILNGEIRSPEFSLFSWWIPKWKVRDRMILLAFLDYAYGWDFETFFPDPTSFQLAGYGPGVRYYFGEYITVKADWGVRIIKSGYSAGPTELHFSIIGSY